MTCHGGKILDTVVTQNIFLGTSWASYSGDKITGLDQWYMRFKGLAEQKATTALLARRRKLAGKRVSEISIFFI